MEKLQHALAIVLEKLGNVTGALHAEQRVVGHQHKVWKRANYMQEAYEKRADTQRQLARVAKTDRERKQRKAAARRWNVKSEKQGRKALAAKRRAQPHIADVKRLAVRVHGLEVDAEQIRGELDRMKQDHGIRIANNTATGGTRRQRVVAVALASVAACSRGTRANRYSQVGEWDIKHVITGEGSGARSDCSQWLTAVYHAAQCRDPNKLDYGGGFTGTLLTGGKAITRGGLRPADAIIYGEGNGFHTELFIGPGNRTAGHGSPPIDFGIIDLIPGAEIRYRSYL